MEAVDVDDYDYDYADADADTTFAFSFTSTFDSKPANFTMISVNHLPLMTSHNSLTDYQFD